MPGRGILRPRILAAIFGGYILVIAIIAWYFASGLKGPWYLADLSRWVYATYMIVAAALLAGIGVVAVSAMRHLDRLIDETEAAAMKESPGAEVAPEEHEDLDALPPPLKEAPAGRDHVDQDIDELLVSLQEIESSAEQTEGEVVVEPAAVETTPARKGSATAGRKAPGALAQWKRRRAEVPSLFAGPALISIAILGICAAMLPGVDGMLQSYYALNTALILAMGYSYGGIALYAGLSVYAILRQK